MDDDIVTGARAGLAAAGYSTVRVLLGDGALGDAGGAPFDRIVATVGAFDLPPAWLDQLAPDGLLVVPLRLRGGVSRSIAFQRGDGVWQGVSSQMCTFMPLRASIADDRRRITVLTEDGAVTLHTYQDQAVDSDLLAGVFDRPGVEAWTGVLFGGAESFEWLDLWLACTMPNAVSRMPVEQSAVDAGIVRPQFGWGAMAVADKADLAYLTLRPVDQADGAGRRYEVGVIGHGPTGGELAGRVAEQVRSWNSEARSRTAGFDIQPAGAAVQLTGQFVFTTPRNRLAITWQ